MVFYLWKTDQPYTLLMRYSLIIIFLTRFQCKMKIDVTITILYRLFQYVSMFLKPQFYFSGKEEH